MKKAISILFTIVIFLDIIDNKYLNNRIEKDIINYFYNNTFSIIMNEKALDSEYKYDEFSNKVKNTSNFTPSNKDELLNVYYTFLNNGLSDFTYYCDKNYTNCIDEI